MRCPNCAGEIPAASRFCGICGRNITAAPGAIAFVGAGGTVQPDTLGADLSMSLFELPGQRRARAARVALVLAIDAILVGAGVLMAWSWWQGRDAKPVKGKPRIELMAPTAAGAAAVAPEPGPGATVTPAADPKAGPKPKPKPGAKTAPATMTPPGPGPSPSPSPTTSTSTLTGPGPALAGPDAAAEPDEAEVEEYAERVRIVVQSHGSQIERCYERAAKGAGPSDPLEGRIDLRFTLMPNGSAENVEVAGNTTGSEQLASCVAELFRSWSMPHGASLPIPLEWPVAFHPPA